MLVEVRGDQQLQHLLHRSTFIGRAPGNSIQLQDAIASRHHAEVRRLADGRFEIEDMKSSHGTFVGTERIDSRVLADGDTLIVGATRFRFVESGEWRGVGQRWHERVACDVSVRIKVGLKFVDARSIDLSFGGMRIDVDQQFEAGAELQLSVGFENRRRRFSVRGRVTDAEPNAAGLGIAFIFDTAAQEAIVAAEIATLLRA